MALCFRVKERKIFVNLKENLLAEKCFSYERLLHYGSPNRKYVGWPGLLSWFPPDDEPVRRIRPARHFTKASWAKLILKIIGGNGSRIYLGLFLGNTAQFLKGQKGLACLSGLVLQCVLVCVCVCVGVGWQCFLILSCASYLLSVQQQVCSEPRAQTSNHEQERNQTLKHNYLAV